MNYLVRKKRINKRKTITAHIWNDNDTLCRMHVSKGLDISNYVVVDELLNSCKICLMCDNRANNS